MSTGMDPTTTIHLPQVGDKASPHVGYVSAIAWSPTEGNILASGCKVAPRGAKVPAMLCIWDINGSSRLLMLLAVDFAGLKGREARWHWGRYRKEVKGWEERCQDSQGLFGGLTDFLSGVCMNKVCGLRGSWLRSTVKRLYTQLSVPCLQMTRNPHTAAPPGCTGS